MLLDPVGQVTCKATKDDGQQQDALFLLAGFKRTDFLATDFGLMFSEGAPFLQGLLDVHIPFVGMVCFKKESPFKGEDSLSPPA